MKTQLFHISVKRKINNNLLREKATTYC